MRIKITHPVPDHQAGETVEIDDELALEWIENDWAFEVKEEVKPKKEKVKYDNRQN